MIVRARLASNATGREDFMKTRHWTHVRKLLGYLRYDSPRALEAINRLYRNELRLLRVKPIPS